MVMRLLIRVIRVISLCAISRTSYPSQEFHLTLADQVLCMLAKPHFFKKNCDIFCLIKRSKLLLLYHLLMHTSTFTIPQMVFNHFCPISIHMTPFGVNLLSV